LLELELRWGEDASPGARFASFLLDAGLVLERIEARHRSFHEEEDDAFGLRGKLRRLLREWIRHGTGGCLSQQARQSKTAEAGARRLQYGASRER
jgi:hypothetical protein